jgi:hypothetical protein
MCVVWDTVRTKLAAALSDNAGAACSNADAHRMLQCWASWAVCVDAECALAQQQAGERDGENAQTAVESQLVSVLRWATETIVPAPNAATDDLAGSLLALVIAQSADLLYLDLASDAVYAALIELLDLAALQTEQVRNSHRLHAWLVTTFPLKCCVRCNRLAPTLRWPLHCAVWTRCCCLRRPLQRRKPLSHLLLC